VEISLAKGEVGEWKLTEHDLIEEPEKDQ